MGEDYYLKDVNGKICADFSNGLAPIIDLTQATEGIEGKLHFTFGEGDQEGRITHQGVLRRENNGYVFISGEERFELGIGDIARKMAWGFLEINVPVEKRFLSEYIDCFFQGTEMSGRMCPAYAINERQPGKFFRGIIPMD